VKNQNTRKIVIPDGKGKKLEKIEPVAGEINSRTKNDELLRDIHNIILGRATKKVDVKGNLLEFNGIVYDETKTREYWEKKLGSQMKNILRQVCAFFGLNPSGNKEEICDRLLDFLEKPKDTGETFEIPHDPSKKRKAASRDHSSSRSRSRSRSPVKKKQKTGKKKDPNAPKKPLTAYIRYSQDTREEVKKKTSRLEDNRNYF